MTQNDVSIICFRVGDSWAYASSCDRSTLCTSRVCCSALILSAYIGAEKQMSDLVEPEPGIHGIVIASGLVRGPCSGPCSGVWPADKFGRRATPNFHGRTLFISGRYFGPLFIESDVYSFITGGRRRSPASHVNGRGTALQSADIAPPKIRSPGWMFIHIVFGIVIALFPTPGCPDGTDAWRWMSGVAALPSLIYTRFSVLGRPESPSLAG